MTSRRADATTPLNRWRRRARAAAESAARAGFEVTALDAFGDLDQHPSVRALSVPRDFGTRFSAAAAARAARSIESEAVMYVSSFENHPKAVGSLGAGRELWGNPPSVLQRVRDPFEVARALRKRGHAVPSIRMTPARTGRWLLKPVLSGGGRRVRVWQPGRRVPRGCYLQEFVEGTPGSIVFVAARGRAVPIGVSRQLIGEDAFGAAGFQVLRKHSRRCRRRAVRAGPRAGSPRGGAGWRDCRGVRAGWGQRYRLCRARRRSVRDRSEPALDGIDGARGARLWPVGLRRACRRVRGWRVARRSISSRARRGRLPWARPWSSRETMSPLATHAPGAPATDHRPPTADHWIRDIPHPGERIAAGRPVCTVLAAGRDALDCHAALVERAGRVYADLAAPNLRVRLEAIS